MTDESLGYDPRYDSRLTGRLGAEISWARTKDRSARTQPARDAFNRRFLDEADGDPERAAHLRRAYYIRLSMKSAEVRRQRKQQAAS